MTCDRCDSREHETLACPIFGSGKLQDIALLITILLQEYEINTEQKSVRMHILNTATEIDKRTQQSD